MYISAFSDELALDVAKALPIVASWGLDAVDFRGRVFGKSIHALNAAELVELRTLLAAQGMTSAACSRRWPRCTCRTPRGRRAEAGEAGGDHPRRRCARLPAGAGLLLLAAARRTARPARRPARRAAEGARPVRARWPSGPGRPACILAFENCGVTPTRSSPSSTPWRPRLGPGVGRRQQLGLRRAAQGRGRLHPRWPSGPGCVHVKARGAVVGRAGEAIPVRPRAPGLPQRGAAGPRQRARPTTPTEP